MSQYRRYKDATLVVFEWLAVGKDSVPDIPAEKFKVRDMRAMIEKCFEKDITFKAPPKTTTLPRRYVVNMHNILHRWKRARVFFLLHLPVQSVALRCGVFKCHAVDQLLGSFHDKQPWNVDGCTSLA